MSDSTKRRLSRLAVLAMPAVLVAGVGTWTACSNTSTPTTPTVTGPVTTETFSGSIDQGGSAVYSFAVKTGGLTVLAGYTSITPTSVTALGMGIATWDATTSTCGLNQTQNDTAKAGSTALNGTADAGNYCIRVYDGGNIPTGVTASFTVQVQHY